MGSRPPPKPIVVWETLAVAHGSYRELLVKDEAGAHVSDCVLVHRVDARKQLCLRDAAPIHKQLPPDVLSHACKPFLCR